MFDCQSYAFSQLSIIADHSRNAHPRRPPQHARLGAPRRGHAGRNMAQRGRGPRPPPNPSQNADTLNPNQMLSKPKEVPNRSRQQQQPRPSGDDPTQNRENSKGRPVRTKQRKTKDSIATQGEKESVTNNDSNTDENQQEDEEEVENKEVLTEELDEKEGLR